VLLLSAWNPDGYAVAWCAAATCTAAGCRLAMLMPGREASGGVLAMLAWRGRAAMGQNKNQTGWGQGSGVARLLFRSGSDHQETRKSKRPGTHAMLGGPLDWSLKTRGTQGGTELLRPRWCAGVVAIDGAWRAGRRARAGEWSWLALRGDEGARRAGAGTGTKAPSRSTELDQLLRCGVLVVGGADRFELEGHFELAVWCR
jgi:hypothetical protein